MLQTLIVKTFQRATVPVLKDIHSINNLDSIVVVFIVRTVVKMVVFLVLFTPIAV